MWHVFYHNLIKKKQIRQLTYPHQKKKKNLHSSFPGQDWDPSILLSPETPLKEYWKSFKM